MRGVAEANWSMRFLVSLGTSSAISKLNPKLKALNSKQILISKSKTQNSFGHLDFGHLILFSISDLGFRILLSPGLHTKPVLSGEILRSAQNDNKRRARNDKKEA